MLLSIASAAKLVRSGCTRSRMSRSTTIAPLLARSSVLSGSTRRRIALWSWLALTRKWTQPIPSPSARIAAASVLRASAPSRSAVAASLSRASTMGMRLVSLSGCSSVSRFAAADSASGSVRSPPKSCARSAAKAAARRSATSCG